MAVSFPLKNNDRAGYSNTSGTSNQLSGYESGFHDTTGSRNQFSGVESGHRNTTGKNTPARQEFITDNLRLEKAGPVGAAGEEPVAGHQRSGQQQMAHGRSGTKGKKPPAPAYFITRRVPSLLTTYTTPAASSATPVGPPKRATAPCPSVSPTVLVWPASVVTLPVATSTRRMRWLL